MVRQIEESLGIIMLNIAFDRRLSRSLKMVEYSGET